MLCFFGGEVLTEGSSFLNQGCRRESRAARASQGGEVGVRLCLQFRSAAAPGLSIFGSLQGPQFGYQHRVGLSPRPAQPPPQLQHLHPRPQTPRWPQPPPDPTAKAVGADAGPRHEAPPGSEPSAPPCIPLPAPARRCPTGSLPPLGLLFLSYNPASRCYFHGNPPEICSNVSAGVTEPPSPPCPIFQAPSLPISGYR